MNRPLFAGALALAASSALCAHLAAQQLFPPDGAPPQPGQAELPSPPAAERRADADGQGEVLTRGPVHEAFAEPVQFNPKPGAVVPKQPPAPIEELPPDQKPEGQNV